MTYYGAKELAERFELFAKTQFRLRKTFRKTSTASKPRTIFAP